MFFASVFLDNLLTLDDDRVRFWTTSFSQEVPEMVFVDVRFEFPDVKLQRMLLPPRSSLSTVIALIVPVDNTVEIRFAVTQCLESVVPVVTVAKNGSMVFSLVIVMATFSSTHSIVERWK
jgi:hypothetical protein